MKSPFLLDSLGLQPGLQFAIAVIFEPSASSGARSRFFEQAVEVGTDWEERAGGLLQTFKQHLGLCREAMGFASQNGDASNGDWRRERSKTAAVYSNSAFA